MFKIRMLPADYGDCLWVEYGSARAPHRLLIDAGTLAAYPHVRAAIAKDLDEAHRQFQLFIVTHVDLDHIDAAVRLLNSPSLKLRVGEVWFNGWDQLVGKDVLGPRQGEYLSALVAKQGIPLNHAFKSGAIFAPAEGRLPRLKLPGGMTLTVLAPGPDDLRRLRAAWKKTMGKDAGNTRRALREVAAAPRYKDVLGKRKGPDVTALAEANTPRDRSVPNGSSIVLLAEYGGKSCLFAADTRPDILEPAVDRLLRARKQTRLHLDALKVPHHGSRFNVTTALIRKFNCRKFLISTNGVKFDHPDPESIARIILYGGPGAELYFNYATPRSSIWDDPALKRRYRYKVVIRSSSARSLDVEL